MDEAAELARIERTEQMWARLKTAAEAGLLLGVKWGLAVILTLWSISWVLGDYNLVRQRAENGQRAFEIVTRSLAAQQTQEQ